MLHFSSLKKRRYLPHYLSDKSLNVTVVNWTCSSENDWSLEITTRVPSSMFLYFRHIKAYDPHEGKDNERRLTG